MFVKRFSQISVILGFAILMAGCEGSKKPVPEALETQKIMQRIGENPSVEQYSASRKMFNKGEKFNWIQTSRAFLLDAYQPPFAPELEYDAEALARTMVDMNVNVIRLGTMGKYVTIQGTRFSTHPDQGDRDLLQETIEACKPRGIKVIPYISVGHKIAWSMVTKDYPEYGQKTKPGGLPDRNHMYVGEDHGTVCWMGPYKEAYLEYVEHVVRDYDIDGIYFDGGTFYFWPGRNLCYCDGCTTGFRKATGLEIPYHENDADYTAKEEAVIDKYHKWYRKYYMTNVFLKVEEVVRKHKDIPMIRNINNPRSMARQDSAVMNAMDAFLYERGHTILERAEGVGVPRSVGLHVWPYVGTYHNWPRIAFQGANYQQEIFTNLMFGGGSIVAQPTGYIDDPENREFVRFPFGIIEKYEKELTGLKNYPHVGVLFAYNSPEGHLQSGWFHGETSARTSSLGAFAACLYNHVQVSSISEFVLDDPEMLKPYPILYLPNVPYLSEQRVKSIKDYVANGGCLIGSYATTLFDAKGDKQSKFDLEELFKVRPFNPQDELADIVKSYTASLGGPNDLYLLVAKENTRMIGSQWENKLYPMWYYEPVETLEGAEVLMNIVTGHDRKPILPGIVISEYGKGKVVYCAATLESIYGAQGPNTAARVITGIIDAVSPAPHPFTVEAPAGLMANMAFKENLMVLHLTNWTGNKFEKIWFNEYYLAPVENVRLKINIPGNKKVKKVSTLVDAPFQKSLNGRRVDIVLPRVEAYQGILVELE